MADWGADVTWLENTGYGDTVRDAKNAAQAERRNCRSVALNQFTPEGKEVLLKMLKDTDIFFESSKGGTWDRKGFTDEAMVNSATPTASSVLPTTAPLAPTPASPARTAPLSSR